MIKKWRNKFLILLMSFQKLQNLRLLFILLMSFRKLQNLRFWIDIILNIGKAGFFPFWNLLQYFLKGIN